MSAFDGWADYYDLIHRGLPGEAEFYVGQAVRIGGPALELGCGTGRLAIPMAMSGVDVVGLDNSAGMLEICREKHAAVGPVSGSLELVEADMTVFSLRRQFRFVAMAYRTIMHLHLPAQQRAALKCVRAHLAPGGIFILNTWAPSPSTIAAPQPAGFVEAGRYDLPDGGVVRHSCRTHFDGYLQRLVEEHRIEETDRSGRVVESRSLPLVRTWTTLREMDNLVRLSGFDVEAVFGDFDCNPIGPSSTEMIWVLRPSDDPASSPWQKSRARDFS